MDEEPAEGLRERKKRQTQQALQAAAVRLLREQGWAATTVDQIAADAGVSQRTFFRYFPTKESVFVSDLQDDAVAAALAQASDELSIADAYHAACASVFLAMTEEQWQVEQERMLLVVQVPDLVGTAALGSLARPLGDTVRFVARRLGLPEDDPVARIHGATLVAAAAANVVPLVMGGQPNSRESLLAAMRLGLDTLQEGFPTGLPPA